MVYEGLWDQMRHNGCAVLDFLRELENHDNRNDETATLMTSGMGEKMIFLISETQEILAANFLRGLKIVGVVKSFEFAQVGNNMITATLVTPDKNKRVFEKIFEEKMLQNFEPTIRQRKGNAVSIKFRSTKLNELAISDEKLAVLKSLEEAHLLTNLKLTDRIESKIIGFQFVTASLRDFLTPQRVVKSFLYRELLKSGKFDVACDVKFESVEGATKDFALVAVKEFAAVLMRIVSEPEKAVLYEFSAQGIEVLHAKKVVFVLNSPDESFKSLARALQISILDPTDLPDLVDKIVKEEN